jgi:hypothetical protein
MSKQKKELGRGSYYAEQVPGVVIIHAVGMTPTPNYRVWLEQGPEDVFPPIHYLYWLPPGGIQLQVLTPFHVYAMFNATETIDTVKVRDADGLHQVKVEQVPELGKADLKDLMARAAAQVGRDVEFKGLMIKVARIRHSAGTSPKDVLGWDYIFRAEDGTCYKFYAAQSPLIGMTQPVPVPCPLGVQAFDHYQVDFVKAIEIMHELRCGDTFVAMQLSWPLTPECTEPIWHIRTSIGNDIVIGANSGEPGCHQV